MFSALLGVLCLLCSGFVSRAAGATEPGAELTISLLTMGPGAHPFTKFGHSAIWVHDAARERDEIYNFGTFAFDSRTSLLDSVEGTLPYWLSVQSIGSTLLTYQEQGRSLLASELDLTPAERQRLYSALRDNARPEHRYYRYDYYRDNCATRVRDAVDRALGGEVQRQSLDPGAMSYRAHTLRLVAGDPLLYVGLDLAIGRETDAKISFWEEGFLPERLHDLFAHAQLTRDGKRIPLIRSERRLFSGVIPAPRQSPPDVHQVYLLFGLLLGAGLVALGIAGRTRRVLRQVLGACLSLLGIAAGSLGVALCYLSFFSAHLAARANYNVLLLPPWLLALAVVASLRVDRGRRAWRVACVVSASAALTTLASLALHLLASNAQQNAQEIALFLPLWLGAALASHLVRARAPERALGASARALRNVPS